MRAFKMLTDSNLEKKATAGTIVYPFGGYDYGIADDDTRATGIKYRSVTLKSGGGYPSFTVAERDLEPVEVEPPPFVDTDYAKTVCKIGQGEKCCRYLVMSPKGWSCEKLTTTAMTLDDRVQQGKMVSAGDNCEGRASR